MRLDRESVVSDFKLLIVHLEKQCRPHARSRPFAPPNAQKIGGNAPAWKLERGPRLGRQTAARIHWPAPTSSPSCCFFRLLRKAIRCPPPPFRESRSPYGTKCLFSFLQTPYLLVVQASLLIHLISALPAPQPVAGLSMDHRIHPFSSSGERHGRRETGSSAPQATVDNPCHMSLRRACGHDFGLPIRCKSR